MDAPILRVIPQRHTSDCSVAALAMICGVTYEEALLATGIENPGVLTSGAYLNAIQKAAKALGVTLKKRKGFDMEDDTGILYVEFKGGKNAHVLVLRAGILVDTDGTLWEPDVYQRTHEATFGPLLIRDDPPKARR